MIQSLQVAKARFFCTKRSFNFYLSIIYIYIYIYLVVLIVNSYYLPLFLFENRKLGGSPGMWKDGEKTHQKLIEQWTGIIKNH